MEKIEKQYGSLFAKLEKLGDNNEVSHMLQDKIYRKFIKDICNDKVTTVKDIKKIANDLKKNVVKYDVERWYA